MLQDYRNDKKALLAALEAADENLHGNVAMYAVLETDDPLSPFETRWVHRAGDESEDGRILNERLFDRAFLDYGYHEVLYESTIEGTQYKPIEELLSDPDCIGVAPLSLFDEDAARVRMAHEAQDEEMSESAQLDAIRFSLFLKMVYGTVLSGEPASTLKAQELGSVCGLLFKYSAQVGGRETDVVAFQRTQRSWVSNKSSYLLFDADGSVPVFFSGQSLKVGTSFDFVLFQDLLMFRNLRALELLFKYQKLSQQRARDYADTFDGILADFEKIDERIDASRGVANKLLRLQKDGCDVAEIDPEELQFRAECIAYYSNKVKFNDEGKVMLTTNTEVNDFLRMLGDAYVVSPLTQIDYEARSKKRLKSQDE